MKSRSGIRRRLAIGCGIVGGLLLLAIALFVVRFRSNRAGWRAATVREAPADRAPGGREGSLLDAPDADGFTPLMAAARANDVAAIESLLAAGADPDRIDGRRGWTPLWHAIHGGANEAVGALLAGGADPNLVPGVVPTLLFAVDQGETEAVRRLLDAGADPRVATSDGVNALVLALEGGFLSDLDRTGRILGSCNDEMVRLLYERAPDLKLPPGLESRMALKIAIFHGCRESLALIREHSSSR